MGYNLVTLMMWLTGLMMPPTPGQVGIFEQYQTLAEQKLSTMTQDEKISQILLVRYPENGAEVLREYQFGGYIFFAKDFVNKTATEVQTEMSELQNIAKIPLLTAVDEEGGLVVRVSSNENLAPRVFASPRELLLAGGMDLIKTDTIEKSQVLQNLGINLNLAPVVDVSTSSNDYMYIRSLGEDAWRTAEYAATVIGASKIMENNSEVAGTSKLAGDSEASKTSGSSKDKTTGVSYTLKHFPGYGNNVDTHTGKSIDRRTFAEIQKVDLLPFQAGIGAGAEAVLVSHNIVGSIDAENPASLSPAVHQLLRKNLGFSGVIITDDIAMGALEDLPDTAVQAVLAGNDLIITTDYAKSIAEIRTALQDGRISQAELDEKVLRILAWKYCKGLLTE